MSTVETHDADTTETPERAFLVREFVASDLEVKGRTVDVRLVPFGEVARVADPPDFVEYDEEWMPGVFDHQLNAANRIHAKYGHSPHVIDVVGHAISLRSEPGDGYHVATKIHSTPQGDTLLQLLEDDALPGVSLEAQSVRSVRTAAGVVQRVKAHLTGFAFCRQGAFAGAQVLAIREKREQIIDEALMPVDMDPRVVERLLRQGFDVPDRYKKAHPAVDTSSEDDTSEPAPAAADHRNSEES